MCLSMKDFNRILECAAHADISDIYLNPEKPAYWKRFGIMSALKEYVPTVADLWSIFSDTASDEIRENYADGDDVEYSYVFTDRYRMSHNFRFSVFRQNGKLAFAIHTYNDGFTNFSLLNEASIIEDYLEGKGLIIVAGSNCSGRTTTISTALKYLSKKEINITILQDVRFTSLHRAPALINNRAFSIDFHDWNKAIKQAYSSGSDVTIINNYDVSMADAIIKLAKNSLVLLRVDGSTFEDVKETLSGYDSKLYKRFSNVVKLTMIQTLEYTKCSEVFIHCLTK